MVNNTVLFSRTRTFCFFSVSVYVAFNVDLIFAVLGFSIFRLILCISAPIMIVKTVISLIHLVDASMRLAATDAAERNQKK